MAKEKINDLWVRVFGVPGLAVILTFALPCADEEANPYWLRFLVSAGCTFIVWETNRYLTIYFRNRFPDLRHTAQRLLYQMGSGMLISALLIYGMCWAVFISLMHRTPSQDDAFGNILVGLIATLVISVIYECFYFFSKWKTSLLEAEKLKRENIRFQFESLKSQVNPHFLFNSLNTLTSLIEEEPKNAVQFVQHLSHVYRYVLTTREKDLVLLQEEVQFIRSYLYLLHMRFGNNLRAEINIPEECRQKQLPPLALQLLVENAIKHNIVAAEQPLELHIRIDKRGHLEVENSLQKKQHVEPGSGFGLKNIIKRYQLLGRSDVEISAADNYFTVALPLLHTQPAL